MTDALNAKIRQELGSNAVKKVRKAGHVPAVLYGHGLETVSLSIPTDELTAAIRRGTKMVNLTGGVDESALISDVQWDTFGVDVLHVDLTRVSASEKVQVSVPLDLRGEAPGTRQGGRIERVSHEIRIECPAAGIPDKIEVSVNSLEIDDSLKMSDVKLPEGAQLLSGPDVVVVLCAAPVEIDEEEEGAAAEGIEPEVIGGRKDEEEEGGS
ncbi:MAG: 50S ribosomal protein L25 [Planctomycetes bacterium]|nr:50S ribosomal protein L25 [Planctomycetota bacterium]MBL7044826.1 50S ribosomal protein L25 [Pirellulaceae bacterium]